MSPQRPALPMTWLLCAALLGFLAWAAVSEIDQTVRAQGQLAPAARTQLIQAADGGVLTRIHVQEGQPVARGALLADLERERPQAALQESRAKAAALTAALARARAEADGTALVFDAGLAGYPEFTALQHALYVQRQRSLQQELAGLEDGLATGQEELRMQERLLASGDTSQLELMRARRQVAEARARRDALHNKYRQEARQDAARLAEELAANRYKLDERQYTLDHTTLRAPVAGVVKSLRINTIGGVLRPGDELMQILPTEGPLLVELKVNPADIGLLRPGLQATVQFDAFDYAVYGTLAGTLEYLSADTLSEPGPNGQLQTFYRARVRLAAAPAGAGRLTPAMLKPGMAASVDLRVARRSLLQYLAKPVVKAFHGALQER
jgi:adhesin transport system membrane fusion protein